MAPLSGDIITTVVYGTAATIIGLVTIYQAHKAWSLWNSHRQSQGHPRSDVELVPVSSRATCHPLEVPEAAALPAQVSDEALVMALQYSRSGVGPLNEPTVNPSLAALPANTPTHDPGQGCDQASSRDELQSSTAETTTPTIADLGGRLDTMSSTSPCNNEQKH